MDAMTAEHPADDRRFVSPVAAATICGVSEVTMARWREKRNGPPFIIRGQRVLYEREPLMKWVESKRVEVGGGDEGEPKAPEWMTAPEVAAALETTDTTVRRWRKSGCGPRYYDLDGTIRYRTKDVQAYVASRANP